MGILIRIGIFGSPYDDESFGCYARVIREALEKIIGAEYTVTDETDDN